MHRTVSAQYIFVEYMKKVLYKQTLTLIIMGSIFIHNIIKASIYGVLSIVLNALYILTHLIPNNLMS